MKKSAIFFLILFFTLGFKSYGWGFFAHKLINQQAVFSLPPQMMGFYKLHMEQITDKAVDADRRRHSDENEAPRHYIDIDIYGDSAIYTMPRYWKEAVMTYTEDTLMTYGIVPWHVNRVRYWLIDAFKQGEINKIIQYSADLGHYIADAHVPLHTTENYNGQLSGQEGIHAFWETRLPELFAEDFNLLVGSAEYIEHPQLDIWNGVEGAHLALDSVLSFERQLSLQFTEDEKFSYEEKKDRTSRVYSKEFSSAYHQKLNGQVQRQMKRSIKLVADFWYSCWIEAGQPDLNNLD